MKRSIPLLLSLNGGFVDTAGFLALQGLFTAHVTGNFVTFGAALVNGTSGALAKLLALPMFCAVVILVRLIGNQLRRRGLPALAIMLALKIVLLIAGGACAIALGPFPDGNGVTAIVTGMILVAAMAVQTAVHRVHLSYAPPSTLMTGTSTQMMIDIADLLSGLTPDLRSAAVTRLGTMSTNVGAFAAGCGFAALATYWIHRWAFAFPPLIAMTTLAVWYRSPERR